MPEERAKERRKRERSPSFPFISLKMAVERVEQLGAQYRRPHKALVASALQLWGYSLKSSGGQQTIAALKAFGLLEDTGSGTERRVGLTELAWVILHDKRPGMREQSLKKAARKAQLISDQLARWGMNRPPDPECLSELHLEQGFTQDAAKRFLAIYDETLDFAGLRESDKLSPPPPPGDPSIEDPVQRPPADATMNESTMDIGGGKAVIQWPATLSQADADDLEAWLGIIIRRAKKAAEKDATSQNEAPDAKGNA